MPDTIPIAVRYLVEYAYRSGSIDSGFQSAGALTEGTRAHQKVQKRYGERDQKEVYMSAELEVDGLLFVLDGRCDGVLFSKDGVTIDEIKSTAADIGLIAEETFPVHWAQAKCYAYMYAQAHGISRMRIQLTYVQTDTEAQKKFVQEASLGELAFFVTGLVEQYAPYALMQQRHKRLRDASIAGLPFPFPAYRAGQRKLAGAVYKTIKQGAGLFAKAPTGIGKTMSVTFPAVKAIGAGLLQRMFYLTAKTLTRTAAEEALSLMRNKGLRLHAVTLTAKEKICFQEEVRCTKEACEFADGYYDRVNEALLDMLSHETLMTRGVIERYARKHRLCPFELSLDASYAADAVICDYNYVFDPRVNLKRLLAEQRKQTVLLIDEAHNLVDRARDMYSAALQKSPFLALQRECKSAYPDVYKASKAVNDYFISVRKRFAESRNGGGSRDAADSGTSVSAGLSDGSGISPVSRSGYRTEQEPPPELAGLLEAFLVQAERALAGAGAIPASPLLLDVYFACQSFMRIWKLYDERYITYWELSKSEVRVKLFCLNPSYLLRQAGKGYRSHIYFSATLSPSGYYMDMLGAGPEDYTVSVPSPFSSTQLEVDIQPLSTRYQDRERTMRPLARLLQRLTDERPGNYLFFFPSYAYMNGVYEAFRTEERGVKTLLQQADMAEDERERFLQAFEAGNNGTLAGFAVMGGIFSEGIDLVGDRLTGVAVVGVGLPQIGLERNLIKSYFDDAGKNGFDYAYVYPGMNKVLQAGGRLIRSERDSGLLLLVDDRYLQPRYQRLLPEEWRHYTALRGEAAAVPEEYT
ncbi:ATP-dependent DNA helicase [Paenibacillus piri]|uniref:ATP-dependent DNA helicase n=1 Tax=Paenibacillus piri TaxID=2547395 RepID=A0A4R5KGC8_9BACL|nr:ATP-dependent DNA helicase [Paenibacillus piri]TDF94479.1 ATP-dependent DNA helicase [Paenibacillus piri]